MLLEGMRNGLEKFGCRVTFIGENNIAEYKDAIIDFIPSRERQTGKMNGIKEEFNSWVAIIQALIVWEWFWEGLYGC